MYALEVTGLRKTYGNGVEALKGISLTVDEGDFFALLGPNGAGKSTLIGIIASLVNSSGGDARVFGISVQRERSRAMSCIGLVPQELNFNQFEKPLEIAIDADEQLHLDGTAITFDDFRARIAETDPQRDISLRVDSGVEFGTFVPVMDTLKARGMEKLSIITRNTR